MSKEQTPFQKMIRKHLMDTAGGGGLVIPKGLPPNTIFKKNGGVVPEKKTSFFSLLRSMNNMPRIPIKDTIHKKKGGKVSKPKAKKGKKKGKDKK